MWLYKGKICQALSIRLFLPDNWWNFMNCRNQMTNLSRIQKPNLIYSIFNLYKNKNDYLCHCQVIILVSYTRHANFINYNSLNTYTQFHNSYIYLYFNLIYDVHSICIYRVESAFADREHRDFHVIAAVSWRAQKKPEKKKKNGHPVKCTIYVNLMITRRHTECMCFSETAMHSGVSA